MKLLKGALFTILLSLGTHCHLAATKLIIKPASKAHPKKHKRGVVRKNFDHGMVAQYHHNFDASAAEREQAITTEEATQALVAAFDTYCKRYRIHLEPKQRTKHLGRVQAKALQAFGTHASVSPSEVRTLKRELKNYLKFYFPDNFGRMSFDGSALLTWKQAKIDLRDYLINFMHTEFGFAPDSKHSLRLWGMLKHRLNQKLDNAAIFDEAGLWVIDRERMPGLRDDAASECRHLYDLWYTDASYQRAIKGWHRKR